MRDETKETRGIVHTVLDMSSRFWETWKASAMCPAASTAWMRLWHPSLLRGAAGLDEIHEVHLVLCPGATALLEQLSLTGTAKRSGRKQHFWKLSYASIYLPNRPMAKLETEIELAAQSRVAC